MKRGNFPKTWYFQTIDGLVIIPVTIKINYINRWVYSFNIHLVYDAWIIHAINSKTKLHSTLEGQGHFLFLVVDNMYICVIYICENQLPKTACLLDIAILLHVIIALTVDLEHILFPMVY